MPVSLKSFVFIKLISILKINIKAQLI